jgi:hypothetical protein
VHINATTQHWQNHINKTDDYLREKVEPVFRGEEEDSTSEGSSSSNDDEEGDHDRSSSPPHISSMRGDEEQEEHLMREYFYKSLDNLSIVLL